MGPSDTIADLPMPTVAPHSPAHRILGEVFGYSSFRPGQEEVIAHILDGTSVLAVMPTGSGKSLCYQIPALIQAGLSVVVSPLVALMEDQVAALKLDGVAAETINSSHQRHTNVATWRRVAAGAVRLLYISPERLMTERMVTALQRLGLVYTWCTISIVDRDADRLRMYGTSGLPDGSAYIADRLGKTDLSFGPDTIERLESEEGPFFITGIPGSGVHAASYLSTSLDSYYGRQQSIDRTTSVSRTDEEMVRVIAEYKRYWKLEEWPKELWLRSVLRTPFSGGTIALSDTHPDHFGEREAHILERFADAISLGYARYLDFRQLEEQNKALTAASRVKSEFLANMSHELRTPMNAIINFSSMVLDGVCGEISDELRDVIGEIDQNGEHLLSLINDVLDLSKIEAGAMELQRAPCDPADCVETVVAALEHTARKKGLELKAVAPDDLPPVLADERRLTQQILLNLVKNAIKFTHAGQVECGARPDNGDVLFWVADTGIGIAPSELERIFETFHQVDTSITRQAEGTGLGLAIAMKFVELHRGRIWVESEEGKGSTFFVTIPAAT